MTNEDTFIKLKELLTSDLNLCKKVLNQLNDERKALSTVNLINLEKVLNDKSNTMLDLIEIQEARDSFLSKINVKPGYEGIKEFINSHSDNNTIKECRSIWQELGNTISKINDDTVNNSAVVNNQMFQTNKILEVMFGSKDYSSTYNKSGRKTNASTDNISWQTDTKI